jgi:hypothetical protein
LCKVFWHNEDTSGIFSKIFVFLTLFIFGTCVCAVVAGVAWRYFTWREEMEKEGYYEDVPLVKRDSSGPERRGYST